MGSAQINEVGGGVGTKRKAGGAPLDPQINHPTFTPVNPPGVSQVPAVSTTTGVKKKARVDKPPKTEFYSVPPLANTTPFVTKLKFMLDNPAEFGEAIRWE